MKRTTDHPTRNNGITTSATGNGHEAEVMASPPAPETPGGEAVLESATTATANEVLAAAAAAAAAIEKLDGLLAGYGALGGGNMQKGRISAQQADALGAIVSVIAVRPEAFVTRKKGQKPQAFDLTTAQDQIVHWRALDGFSSAADKAVKNARNAMALIGGELRGTVGKAYPAARTLAERDEEARSRLTVAEQVYGKGARSRRKNELPEKRAQAKADSAARAQAQQARAAARVAAATAALERAKARAAASSK